MTTPQQSQGGFGQVPGYGAPQGMPQAGVPGGYPGGAAPGGPGPYGQPPQPIGPVPYGQPGPYGIPQQAPQFGYGGGPGMPPIPPKRKAGKAWGILGAVAGMVVVGTVVSAMGIRGGGSSSGGSDGGPRYRITVPQTLAGGEYKLAKDISQQAGSAVPSDGANEHNIKAVGGQYSSGTKSLVMLGLYGVIDDPDTTIEHTIRGMTRDGKTEVAVADKEFRPRGGGDSLTCGVDVRTEMGQKVTLPFCVWADSSTSGNVAETDASELAKDPQSVDLQKFADKVDKIRGEVRKPLG
ncbi:hypothetical protein TPA0598_05_04160 [Streptomyces lydicamycinicus]|uniref:Uncharacterized protein n=2 Tax=Streptomyces lydicamycinicus TaxID=1546107 RepID=A0A0P4RAV5_9ACTN|nr:hypothetical protein TPA0598_05_04160 [Streptomyces lydicamycinicus]